MDENGTQLVKILTDDIQAHRDYIQRLYRNAFMVGGAGLLIALALVYWVLGKQFDSKIIDYVVDENVIKRVNAISDRTIANMQDISKTAINHAETAARDTINGAVSDAKENATKSIVKAQTTAVAKVNYYLSERIGTEVSAGVEKRLSELTTENLAAIIEQITFPSGMVAAFDREVGCPNRWEPYSKAQARVIVGAGPHSNRDQNGVPLTAYDIGFFAGTETHTLSVAEMPKHNHGGQTSADATVNEWHGEASDQPVLGGFKEGPHTIRNEVHTHLLDQNGASEPHNNMPPFVALLYCIRK